MLNIKTLGELKASGYQSKSIKQELRDNLILKLKSKTRRNRDEKERGKSSGQMHFFTIFFA